MSKGIWTIRDAERLKRDDIWPNILAPNNINGLQLWLDSSDSLSLFDATTGGSLVSANGTVARWQDKSGNGRHLIQGTLSKRPIYSPTGTALRKSQISFNSTNQTELEGANPLANNESFTLAFIGNVAVVRGQDGFGDGWSIAGGSVVVTTPSVVQINRPSISYNNIIICGLNQGVGTFGFAMDAVTINANTSTILRSSTKNWIIGQFNGTYGNGGMSELALFNRVLKTNELRSLSNYLRNKWLI